MTARYPATRTEQKGSLSLQIAIHMALSGKGIPLALSILFWSPGNRPSWSDDSSAGRVKGYALWGSEKHHQSRHVTADCGVTKAGVAMWAILPREIRFNPGTQWGYYVVPTQVLSGVYLLKAVGT